MVVAIGHTLTPLFPNTSLPFPVHDAVIVFFVISGFVIAHTAEIKDRTLIVYLTNRLSRLWSVAIPALLLGALIVPIVGGYRVAGAAPPPLDWSSVGIRSALNLFFVSQFWGLDQEPPFNFPFWSISYEAAYYAIFAAWTFAGKHWRTVSTVVCCVLAGPKILLLMPCWLLGVWLYRHPNVQNMKQGVAITLFVGSILGYLTVFWVDLAVT
jgi:peptidoglycan/LPS O-acetylase OafA/YrhL